MESELSSQELIALKNNFREEIAVLFRNSNGFELSIKSRELVSVYTKNVDFINEILLNRFK